MKDATYNEFVSKTNLSLYSDEGLEMEIGFAETALATKHLATVQWLVALHDEKILRARRRA